MSSDEPRRDRGDAASATAAVTSGRSQADERRVEGSWDDAGWDGTSTALAAAQIGEWSHDLSTGEITLSVQARRLLGLDEAAPVSVEDVRARRLAEDRVPFQAVRDKVLADPANGFIRQSYRIRRPDATVRWVESRGAIFRDPEGRAMRLTGVMLDVTDWQEREQFLQQSWHRIETALVNTAIVLFAQDRDLRYTWIHNPPMGMEAHRIIGKTDVEIMGADRAADIVAAKRRVLQTDRAIQIEVVLPLERGSGSFDLHIQPLHNGDRQVAGIACAGIELAKTTLGRRRAAALLRHTVEDRSLLLDKLSARLDPQQRHRGLLPTGIGALARRLGAYVDWSAVDEQLLEALVGRCSYVAGKQPLAPPETMDEPRLVGNGWAYSYGLLADGRRQVIAFHLPGDVINLLATSAPRDGSRAVATASDSVVCDLDRAVLDQLLYSGTLLGEGLRRLVTIDAALTEQRLVSIGRRRAEASLAHLLLELGSRLEAIGLADPGGYRCPLTQELIADALGLTNVHINRLLRRLRDQGLLTFANGFVAFVDKPRLIELAEYDPSFLVLPDARVAEQQSPPV